LRSYTLVVIVKIGRAETTEKKSREIRGEKNNTRITNDDVGGWAKREAKCNAT